MPVFTVDDVDTTDAESETLTLPLGMLCHQYDAANELYTSALRTDLPALFWQYAQFMQGLTLPGARLDPYQDVYEKWIKLLLNPLETELKNGPNTTSTQLLAEMNKTRTAAGVMFYLGLYFFIVWYLVVHATGSAPDQPPWQTIRRYVAQRLKRELDRSGLPGANVLIWAAGDNANWKSAFDPNRPICITATNAAPSLADIVQAFDTRADMTHRAVTLLREGVQAVLKKEMRLLLREVWASSPGDGDPRVAYVDISWIAIGDGSGTKGFFGQNNWGIIFFEYLPTGERRPFQVANTRHITGSGHTSFFLSCVGKDSTGDEPCLTVVVGPAYQPRYLVQLASKLFTDPPDNLPAANIPTWLASGYFLNQSGAGWTHADGHLRFDASATDSVAFTFGPSAIIPNGGFDELAVMVFEHDLDSDNTAAISIARLFDDNEFIIPPTDSPSLQKPGWQEFWAGSEAGLDLLIDFIVENPDCALTVIGAGNGLATAREPTEVGQNQASVRRDRNQTDRIVTEAAAAPLRCSFGEARWSDEAKTLTFVAHGYVSPTPCTWPSWSRFDAAQKAALTQDFPLITQWNQVLSAFRAYALLDAMIQRFDDRAQVLEQNLSLSSTDADKVCARLADSRAKLEASVLIHRERNRRPRQITVTKTLFDKYD